jgi:tetratricopeptide (TPR) repeat protein
MGPCAAALLLLFAAPPARGGAGQDAAAVERHLQQAVRAAPGSFEAQHNLGEFYIQQGRLKAAVPPLEKASAIDPSHYVNGYDLALAYLQLSRLPQAREQIRRLLQVKETAELHDLLGEVAEKAGDLVAAAEAYHRAAQMDPSEEHLFDWGNSLLQLQAAEPAAQVFGAGVARHPASARLHIGLGIARYARGQYDEAVGSFCRAADLAPADPRPYQFLGEMYGVSPGRAEEVTRRMAGFVKAQPRNAEAHYYYALNLWQGGRIEPAPEARALIEKHLRQAVALDPRMTKAHLQLGIFYFDGTRYPEAIGALKAAVRLDPALAQAHYRLAQAYQRTGQPALAAQEFEAFQRLKERDGSSASPPS